LAEREAGAGNKPPLPPGRRPEPPSGAGQSAPWIIRTALCVEPRDGRLHVFMPPVETTKIIWIWSPASKPPSPKWARRSSSKAKRRRAIRA
jgi:hypothetical protein